MTEDRTTGWTATLADAVASHIGSHPAILGFGHVL